MLWSPEMGIVVVRRITGRRKPSGKADAVHPAEGSSPGELKPGNIRWLSSTTPPGSKGGACIQRGNSGTWESRLAPWRTPARAAG